MGIKIGAYFFVFICIFTSLLSHQEDLQEGFFDELELSDLACPKDLSQPEKKTLKEVLGDGFGNLNTQNQDSKECQGSFSENSLANLDGCPSAMVANAVNVITGDYCDFQRDFVVPGFEPIVIERSYCSSGHQKGLLNDRWYLSHEGQIKMTQTEHSLCFSLTGPLGENLEYKGSKRKENMHFPLNSNLIKYALTNIARGEISGQKNVKNTYLQYDQSNKGSCLVRTGSGTELYFLYVEKKRSVPGNHHATKYALKKQTLPNGNMFVYDYFDKKLINISAYGSGGQDFHSVKIKESVDENKDKVVSLHGSNGSSATYHIAEYEDFTNKKFASIRKAERSDAPNERYAYERGTRHNLLEGERVVRKDRPQGRFMEIDYYRPPEIPVLYVRHTNGLHDKHAEKQDPRLHRVKSLRAPVGADGSAITTHTFVYFLKEIPNSPSLHGYTDVYDVHNHRTSYHFSDSRLTAIEKYHLDNHSTYCIERLFWGDNNSPNSTNLLARSFQGGADFMNFVKTYEYDQAGNVTSEKLFGNLTGNNKQIPKLNPQGIIINNGCECDTKNYTYSNSSRNLLLSETHGNSTKIYSYITERSLLKSCLITVNDEIKSRSFYSYDMRGVLIKEISDDGCKKEEQDLTGVTERKIRYITPTQYYPVGFPEIIEEKYLDLENGKEQLFKKTVNIYDSFGHILRQNHFDNLDVLTHSLFWEYDNHGNVIFEKNEQGQTFTRKYDANDNLIFEQGPNSDYYTEYAYDFSNRLISTKEVHADGLILQSSHRYTRTSKLLASTDFYGNETGFKYDQFDRMIEKTEPAVPDENGNLIHPITKTSYNILGHPVSVTDQLGNSTNTKYTIRGQPYWIQSPDGSIQQHKYTLKGWLKKSISPDGTFTTYTHDYQGRVIKEELFSSSGESLHAQTSTYNAFHLLSQLDSNGLKTTYSYDYAGRLIRVRKGDLRTTFEYDSQNRIIKTVEAYGKHAHEVSVKVQKYDRHNRIIEERVEDHEEKVLRKSGYVYDAAGNRSQMITFNRAGKGICTTLFNSHREPISITDAEGNQTIIQINYSYHNAHNQGVPYKEITDPLGNISITIGDALGRIKRTLRKNAHGKITQESRFFYDAAGNCTKAVETVMSSDKPDREVVTCWTYNSMNRIKSLVEAVGTKEQKETQILYNAYGQKETIIKPDEVQISHSYDQMGRLINFYASDDSFHYHYIYDANHDLVAVEDLKQHTSTLKKYDRNHRLIEEILGNGIKIQYTYDRLSRPKTIRLSDESAIEYSYNAAFLKSVQRISARGEQLYIHSYNEHDLSGNILEAQLINGLKASYRTNLNGQPTQVLTPHWSEKKLTYDGVGNLIERTLKDQIGQVLCKYSYDDLYQLSSEEGLVENRYEHDSLCNRIVKNGTGNIVNALNQLIKDGSYRYLYTASGCLSKKVKGKNATEYLHDALDRLIEVKNETLKVGYVYDELNRRLSKIRYSRNSPLEPWSLQEKERYLYIGQNDVGTVDSSDKIIELRLLGTSQGAEIGGAIALELKGKLLIPIHDHNGNVAGLMNGTDGNPLVTYRYSAFGEEQIFHHSELVEKINSPWRFSSKRIDDETGFIYFGRRYYNPIIGRWTTPDPIGYEDGPNLYAYVKNNPLTHFDLYGLSVSDSSRSNFTSCVYEATKPLREAAGFIGSCVEYVGKNWVPCPVVNDIVEIAGRILGGKSSEGFIPSFNRYSFWDKHEGKEFPQAIFTLGNGMGVSHKEFTEYMDGESRMHHDAAIYGFYKHDLGTFFNIVEAALQKMGIQTQSSKEHLKGIKAIANHAISHGRVVHSSSHSQGCLIYHLNGGELNPEQKNMIMSYTYGSPALHAEGEFGEVINSVSSDGVTFLCDPIGVLRAKVWKDGKVRANFLKPKGNSWPLLDHGWNNETYRAARKENAKSFNEHFGIQ